MKTTRIIVLVGVLSALAFVLYFMEIPMAFLFASAPFLKIDFSDVPAILAAIAAGPFAGAAVELIKNILHFFLISKEPAASGEIANFFSGVFFLVPVALMIRKSIGGRVLPYVTGTIFFTVAISFINYFITLPLYGIGDSATKINLLLYTFAPFNILKGILVSIVTAIMYTSTRRFISDGAN